MNEEINTNIDETIVDVEVEDTRPEVLIQYSGKNNLLRIWCQTAIRVDNQWLKAVDINDDEKGFHRTDAGTEWAFLAYSMFVTDTDRKFRCEISQKFIEARNLALFGTKMEVETDPFMFMWNPQFKLKPAQAAMAHKIVRQFQEGEIANKIAGSENCSGQGFYNISAPGAGKTPISIAVAMKMNAKRVLVVALSSLLEQWGDELTKFHRPGFAPGMIVINPGAKKEDRSEAIAEFCENERAWAICGYATLRDHIGEFLNATTDYDLVIFDESSVMRNENNQVAQAAQRLLFHNRQNQYLDWNEKIIRAKNVIHLNGTPIPNSGAELYNIFRQCRSSHALSSTRDDFEEDHVDVTTSWIPIGNGKSVKKTTKQGIKNVFKLAQLYSDQFGGLPRDKSKLPEQNDIEINCVMNEDEELTYRALETNGYSKIPGLTSLEEFRDNKEKQSISIALDEHRKAGLQTDSLASYLDLVNDSASKLGARTEDDEDSETVEEIDGNEDMLSLTERFDSLEFDWRLLQVDIDSIVDSRKALALALEQAKADLKDETGKYPQGLIVSEHPSITKIVNAHKALGEKGKLIREQQHTIRELQAEIETQRREIRVAEQLRAQSRANTLIRLRRGSSGGEWVVDTEGSRNLVVYPSAKFRWISEFLEQNPNEKTIIYCALRSTVAFLQKHLTNIGVETAILTGGNSKGQTEEIRRFKTISEEPGTGCNIMIMTCEKGIGLNLQVASTIIFESKPYLMTLVEQNIARAVREFGTHASVNVYHLRTKFSDGSPTVDEYVEAILRKKERTSAIFGSSAIAPLQLHFAKSEEQTLAELASKYASL